MGAASLEWGLVASPYTVHGGDKVYSQPGGVGKGLGADQGFRCLLNIYSL